MYRYSGTNSRDPLVVCDMNIYDTLIRSRCSGVSAIGRLVSGYRSLQTTLLVKIVCRMLYPLRVIATHAINETLPAMLLQSMSI